MTAGRDKYDLRMSASDSGQQCGKPIDNPDLLPITAQESIRFGEDTRHRGKLINWMVVIVSGWLGCVIVVVILNGLCLKIADNVMIALLATTTVNVLGLSKIILNGMFRHGGSRHGYTRRSKG